MPNTPAAEVWLRGPVEGVPALLQPVAHALLQCREELHLHLASVSAEQLWVRPSGVPSIGFHVRHAAGSLDRLFTYARGERLTAAQQAALSAESVPDPTPEAVQQILSTLDSAVDRALAQLRATNDATLLDSRGVGRAQLPSTVIGLLFHAAEHTQRHAGQVVTTVRVLCGTQPHAD